MSLNKEILMAEKQPKREPLLKLRTSDKKISALALVKVRAAQRTRSRIMMELEAKEMKRLEIEVAQGKISPKELEELASKTNK